MQLLHLPKLWFCSMATDIMQAVWRTVYKIANIYHANIIYKIHSLKPKRFRTTRVLTTAMKYWKWNIVLKKGERSKFYLHNDDAALTIKLISWKNWNSIYNNVLNRFNIRYISALFIWKYRHFYHTVRNFVCITDNK